MTLQSRVFRLGWTSYTYNKETNYMNPTVPPKSYRSHTLTRFIMLQVRLFKINPDRGTLDSSVSTLALNRHRHH